MIGLKRMILIDGNSLMYRAYYGMAAVGNLTTNSKGLFTNAIYAFARMINHLIQSDYDAILVAFDAGKRRFVMNGCRTIKRDDRRCQMNFGCKSPISNNF